MKTWKLYHRGEEVKKFFEGEKVPEGWEPGYPESRRKKIDEKRRKTNLEKYGAEVSFNAESVREKIKTTNLDRYGVENPFQSEEIKEHIKKTNLEKYGTEYANQSKIVQEKAKKTNLGKYGVEYSFQAKSVKEKIKESMIGRYGVEHALQSEEIFDRMRVNNLEKYGVEYSGQIEEGKEKRKKTCLDKYGVDHPLKRREVAEKVKRTNIEKYGVNCSLHAEGIRERRIQSYIEHYGVDHPSKADEVKAKKIQTSLEHYGTEYPWQSDEIKEKVQKTNMEKYGVPWLCLRPEYLEANSSGNSRPNREFDTLLNESGIVHEREFRVGKYLFDFKVGNTLVEINPSSTHNTLWNPYNTKDGKGLPSDYHLKKSQRAEEDGYRVIHVFDWDDKNTVVKLLMSNRETVYARNTRVRDVTVTECDTFLNENHLQGTCRGQDIRLGLYTSSGRLASIMTFGKPRYNRNYEYELIRYCSECNVIGGAEKLFRAFVEKCHPTSVLSYCDKAKFTGDVYIKLGFRLISAGKPSKHWYNIKTDKHLTDNLVRQRGFDQLFHENYGKGTSNEELLIGNGFVPVFDCGQDTYIWTSEDRRDGSKR